MFLFEFFVVFFCFCDVLHTPSIRARTRGEDGKMGLDWGGSHLLSNPRLILLVISQLGLQLLNSLLRSLLARGQFNPQFPQRLHNIHTQHKPLIPGLWFRPRCRWCLRALFLCGTEYQIMVITVLFRGDFCEAGGFDGSGGGGNGDCGGR